MRAPGGCRTSAPLCRHGFSATSRVSASPISAPHPAARRRELALAGAAVTAVDLSKTRLGMVRANSDRLGLKAELVRAMRRPSARTTDRRGAARCALLVDRHIRRHPDIPYTKSPKDIEALAGLQARLLTTPSALLKPGGTRRLFDLLARARGGRGADRRAHGAEQRAPPRRDRQRGACGGGRVDRAVGLPEDFPYELKLDSPEWSGMDGLRRAAYSRG